MKKHHNEEMAANSDFPRQPKILFFNLVLLVSMHAPCEGNLKIRTEYLGVNFLKEPFLAKKCIFWDFERS